MIWDTASHPSFASAASTHDSNTTTTDTATTLEYDPKLVARVAYCPVSAKDDVSLAAPRRVWNPLTLSIVRFDTRESCVTGLQSWISDDGNCVWYSQLDIEDEPPIRDWGAMMRSRCWWGYASNSRFGVVVPIKELKHVVEGNHGAGTAGHVLLPRSMTLEPPAVEAPDLHTSGAASDGHHSSRSGGRSPRSPRASVFAPLSQSFVDRGSFVRALPLGEAASAASALLQNLTDGDLLAQSVVHPRGVNISTTEGGGRSPQVTHMGPQVAKPPMSAAIAQTLEGVFGEGRTASSQVAVDIAGTSDWLLSLRHSALAVAATAATTMSNAKGSVEIPMTWARAGEILPHFFCQKSSVSAAAYAQALVKHSGKMSFDQSQFVVLIGDSRGLFLVTPNRDVASYCENVSPIVVDGSIASLGRGNYDVSMNGHIFKSASHSAQDFERDLPFRLRLPSPIHQLRCITHVTVQCFHKMSTDYIAVQGKKDAMITTIEESIFTRDDITPAVMASDPDAVWESSVQTQRRIPTHLSWCEPVELVAPVQQAQRKHGRSRSVVVL